MPAHLLPVLLRSPQPFFKRLQPFPPLANSTSQREERLEHSGLERCVPVPEAAGLGVLNLSTLDDIRILLTLVSSLGSLRREALSLRSELHLLPESSLETFQTPLSRFSLSDEFVDTPLGPAEVRSRLRPSLIRGLSVAPQIQARLHTWSSSRNTFLVPIRDIEPEG